MTEMDDFRSIFERQSNLKCWCQECCKKETGNIMRLVLLCALIVETNDAPEQQITS